MTATKILTERALKINSRTVHRALSRVRSGYNNAKHTISLAKKQKENRVRLCTEWLTKPKNWDEVAFTDEKKTELDGPDNWCSWMEENHQFYLNKRQYGGGSLMVWGMIFSTGHIFVKTASGRINSDTYIKLMKDTAIPIMRDILPNGFVLQQDNGSIHVSKKSLDFFEGTGIEVLPWPSWSSDLNITENMWSVLSSRVYDGPQPKNKQELEERVFEAVDHMNSHLSEYVKTLFSS